MSERGLVFGPGSPAPDFPEQGEEDEKEAKGEHKDDLPREEVRVARGPSRIGGGEVTAGEAEEVEGRDNGENAEKDRAPSKEG